MNEKHECCDGECNHDDCCGKVEANCPKQQPNTPMEEVIKNIDYWYNQHIGSYVCAEDESGSLRLSLATALTKLIQDTHSKGYTTGRIVCLEQHRGQPRNETINLINEAKAQEREEIKEWAEKNNHTVFRRNLNGCCNAVTLETLLSHLSTKDKE